MGLAKHALSEQHLTDARPVSEAETAAQEPHGARGGLGGRRRAGPARPPRHEGSSGWGRAAGPEEPAWISHKAAFTAPLGEQTLNHGGRGGPDRPGRGARRQRGLQREGGHSAGPEKCPEQGGLPFPLHLGGRKPVPIWTQTEGNKSPLIPSAPPCLPGSSPMPTTHSRQLVLGPGPRRPCSLGAPTPAGEGGEGMPRPPAASPARGRTDLPAPAPGAGAVPATEGTTSAPRSASQAGSRGWCPALCALTRPRPHPRPTEPRRKDPRKGQRQPGAPKLQDATGGPAPWPCAPLLNSRVLLPPERALAGEPERHRANPSSVLRRPPSEPRYPLGTRFPSMGLLGTEAAALCYGQFSVVRFMPVSGDRQGGPNSSYMQFNLSGPPKVNYSERGHGDRNATEDCEGKHPTNRVPRFPRVGRRREWPDRKCLELQEGRTCVSRSPGVLYLYLFFSLSYRIEIHGNPLGFQQQPCSVGDE